MKRISRRNRYDLRAPIVANDELGKLTKGFNDMLAQIQQRATVFVHSSLGPGLIRACHLEPCEDVSAAVHEELKQRGSRARVAALPYGPLTIPYLITS